MKEVKRVIEKDGSGVLTISTQGEEDIWHIYNLVMVGDHVSNTSMRKVVKTSSTGTSTSSRKAVQLTIAIEDISYGSSEIRLKGKTTSDNEYVKRGAYHTLTIGVNDTFQLHKDNWDTVYLERVEDACNPNISADVAAVVMQNGVGHVCLITNNRTIVRARIDRPIPKKRAGSASRHGEGVRWFHKALSTAVDKNVDFTTIKCLIIASPAHYKDDFVEYFLRHIANDKDRTSIKTKILKIDSTSGHLHSLSEIMQNPEVKRKVDDTKAYKEAAKLGEFMNMLRDKQDWAFFGQKHCQEAASQNAIDCLLVTDGLFRSDDPARRQIYVDLVEEVRNAGGEVLVFSSEHETGKKLDMISGVAAILRLPLPELHNVEIGDPDNYDSEDEDY